MSCRSWKLILVARKLFLIMVTSTQRISGQLAYQGSFSAKSYLDFRFLVNCSLFKIYEIWIRYKGMCHITPSFLWWWNFRYGVAFELQKDFRNILVRVSHQFNFSTPRSAGYSSILKPALISITHPTMSKLKYDFNITNQKL